MNGNLVCIRCCGNGIKLLELCRPDSLNALTSEAVRELHAAFVQLSEDRDCRVILLGAQGRAFSAGLDLRQIAFGDDPSATATARMGMQELFAATGPLMRRLRQPVVAMMQGVAAGAGLAIGLSADIRIATPSTKFLIGAVRIGLTAGECGISYHLPRLIGSGRAAEIMLTGRPVDAEEALAIGLVSRIVAETELLECGLETAQRIAENSPYAVKHTKQLLWSNVDAPSLAHAIELENHAQTVAMLGRDFAEAVSAFVEKRAPLFTGS